MIFKSKQIHLQPLTELSEKLEHLIEGRLWLKVMLGLILGIITGLFLGPDLGLIDPQIVAALTVWLALPGQLFLGLIQMIVVPLVLASVVRGLASVKNPQALKKISGVALSFFLISTALATTIGISTAILVEPGKWIQHETLGISVDKPVASNSSDMRLPSLSDVPEKVMALLPKNPMASMVSGEMLQVILFAGVLGFALLSIPPKQAQPLFELLGALQEVSMRVVSWAMWLAPFAVFGLMARLVANLGLNVLAGMMMYMLTVLIGLMIMALLYVIVVRLVAKIPVWEFLKKSKEVLLLAFSTSSSAAVMPVSLQTVEKELGVRSEIAQFLIPLGATINMSGTALYQGVATLFLAQIFQVDITLFGFIFIVTTAVAASIGSPATPGAGIVILSMVLEGVGIPAAGIGLLLGVDRVLDMSRTTLNVMGDIVACCLVDRLATESSLATTHSATDSKVETAPS
ncbi:MAG TPA: dicarboxylate/amino acid:cation symporter [Gammaproteobacteria bacterium]|nr:dicarboxylate/amino acid:cation symporter [Gammaproteobacteria bacterium]